MLLENKTISENIIEKIINAVKDRFDKEEYKFDLKIGDKIIFWCDGDNEKTVFIQTKDEMSYATFTKSDLETYGVDEIVEGLEEQLSATGAENDE